LVPVDTEGNICSYLDGVQFSPRELSAAIESASQHQTRPQPDTDFLRCYLYDPTIGKFGVLIQWVIRVMSAFTVAGLAIFISIASRSCGCSHYLNQSDNER